MSRLLMPRTLAAFIVPDNDDDRPHGVAVIAMDTTDDAYLVVDGGGNSFWSGMHHVRFVDDVLRTAVNRGDEAARALYPAGAR